MPIWQVFLSSDRQEGYIKMLKLGYINDGLCEKQGFLRMQVSSEQEDICNCCILISAPEVFRGSLKERAVYIPYICAGTTHEFHITYRVARDFSAKKADFNVLVKFDCNGETMELGGSFVREFADFQQRNLYQQTTYHIEHKTTLNATDNAIAYAGGNNSNSYDIDNQQKTQQEIIENISLSSRTLGGVNILSPILFFVDAGKDLVENKENIIEIKVVPCFRAGQKRDFVLKKITGCFALGNGKQKLFLLDEFYQKTETICGCESLSYYGKIRVALEGQTTHVELTDLFCAFQFNDNEIIYSMPGGSSCLFAIPPQCDFFDTPDYGLLNMTASEQAESFIPEGKSGQMLDYLKAYTVAQAEKKDKIVSFFLEQNNLNTDFILALKTDLMKDDKSVLRQSIILAGEQNTEPEETVYQKAVRLFGVHGNGIHPEEAFAVFLNERKNGNIEATEKLAECYLLGAGTPQNIREGCDLLRRAADAGSCSAMVAYAECCFQNICENSSASEAMKYLQKASERDYAPVNILLAREYLTGKHCTKDAAAAFELYCRNAEMGCSQSQYSAGCMLLFGIGCGKNVQRALSFFESASEQNHAGAKIMLARCIVNGLYPDQSLQTAEDLCRTAINANSRLCGFAEDVLGTVAAKKQDDKTALKHFIAGMNSGIINSIVQVGKYLLKGIGVGKDSKLAAELFSFAADRGNTEAILNLAECFLRGIGVYRDYGQAEKLLRPFIGKQNMYADFLLGMMFYHGMGVEENEAKGISLIKAAADSGYLTAQKYLSEIE